MNSSRDPWPYGLPGQQLPIPARSATTPLVDPMPPRSLAGRLTGASRPASASRPCYLGLEVTGPALPVPASYPSASALIRSFAIRLVRRRGRLHCIHG